VEIELTGVGGDAPIVKLVYSLIAQAVEQGASDIHCDPEIGDMQVSFRVDGVLTSAATIARSMYPSVVSRLKIMANLDISERRVPQDGRLAVTIDERRIDVRVVTLPLLQGEGVVMRILDTGAVVRDLDALGMQESDRRRFMAAVNKPHGAVRRRCTARSDSSTTASAASSRSRTRSSPRSPASSRCRFRPRPVSRSRPAFARCCGPTPT